MSVFIHKLKDFCNTCVHFQWKKTKRLSTRSGYCQRCACAVCMTSAISWPNCVFAVARIETESYLCSLQHLPFVEEFHGIHLICVLQLYHCHLLGGKGKEKKICYQLWNSDHSHYHRVRGCLTHWTQFDLAIIRILHLSLHDCTKKWYLNTTLSVKRNLSLLQSVTH